MSEKKEQKFGPASVAILVLGLRLELLGPAEVSGVDSFGRKVKAHVVSAGLTDVLGSNLRKWVAIIGRGTWGGNGRLVDLDINDVTAIVESEMPYVVTAEVENLGDPGAGA